MTAIRVKDVSKCYRFARQRPFLAKEILRRILMRPSSVEQTWALRDVSFEVEEGESVAVVGANGSGKSTLLALIAKTSYPTSGAVEVEGRVGPLLELRAGFHPFLTGYENIYLNGSLLGLSREMVDERRESIIAYADIGPYIDAPLSTYSTGMVARLGFAVLAHIDPDILIVDEALSVGDGEFKQKCQKTMQEMRDRGTTMFLVSHDLRTVKQLCQRAIWLDHGRVRMQGPASEVVDEYLKSFAAATATSPRP
jgi:ABC-type polysaccharide/polyol phosphate transport system ATPase subunit